MKVIEHQTPGMHLPVRLATALAQGSLRGMRLSLPTTNSVSMFRTDPFSTPFLFSFRARAFRQSDLGGLDRQQARRSLVPQRFDRVHLRGAEGGINAEDDADERGNGESQHRRPKGDDGLHAGGLRDDE